MIRKNQNFSEGITETSEQRTADTVPDIIQNQSDGLFSMCSMIVIILTFLLLIVFVEFVI